MPSFNAVKLGTAAFVTTVVTIRKNQQITLGDPFDEDAAAPSQSIISLTRFLNTVILVNPLLNRFININA